MNSSWNTEQLGDVYEFSSGLSKSRSEFGSGYPFLGFKDVFYNSAVPNKLEELVQSNEKEQNKCSIQKGDVFLTRTSETMDELGMSCVALKDIPFATFNGFSKRLRPIRQDSVVPEYARYYFRSSIFKQKVNSMATMSTRASLNNEILQRLEIILPPKNEQKIIGHILGTLDKKIELNKKNNKTLEELSKALFKSWFIDFDPVKAKAEGRSTGLPDEISDLFPDSFEDSELGQIPKGWEVTKIGDCSLQIESGKRPKGGINKELENGIPSIGAESIDSAGIFDFSKTKFVTHDFASSSKKGWVKNLDVALYKDGGKPGMFKPRVAIYGEQYPFDSFMVNEHVFLIRSEEIGQLFLYHLMNSNLVKEQIIQMGSSKGAQPGFNQEELKSTIFPKSNNLLTEQFNKISIPLIKKQLTFGKQNSCLENLRNTILPKLISGELRIPDAEKMIEEAGI